SCRAAAKQLRNLARPSCAGRRGCRAGRYGRRACVPRKTEDAPGLRRVPRGRNMWAGEFFCPRLRILFSKTRSDGEQSPAVQRAPRPGWLAEAKPSPPRSFEAVGEPVDCSCVRHLTRDGVGHRCAWRARRVTLLSACRREADERAGYFTRPRFGGERQPFAALQSGVMAFLEGAGSFGCCGRLYE